VPLQDILQTGGLIANKAATEGSKQGKTADVLKDVNRIAAAAAAVCRDKVDKTSDKPKKMTLLPDSNDADVNDKMKRNISYDKVRRRRRRSSEVLSDSLGSVSKTAPTADDGDKADKSSEKPKKMLSIDSNIVAANDKIKQNISDDKVRRRRQRSSDVQIDSLGSVSKTAPTADDGDKADKSSEKPRKTMLSPDSSIVAANDKLKQNISDNKIRRRRQRSSDVRDNSVGSDKISPPPAVASMQADTQLPGKAMVSSKDHRRRRSRQSEKVTSVPLSQPVSEHQSYGRGTTYPASADVSLGSEAMEDMIQRLLDNDELMDDADQPPIKSPPSSVSTGSGPTAALGSAQMVSPDRRRSREVPKKSGKSSQSVVPTLFGPETKVPVSASQLAVKSPTSSAPTSVNAHTSSRLSDAAASDTDDSSVVSSGPRIKHVCRYASIALGKPIATFPPVSSSQVHLSALPSQEKERILVEKSPGMYRRM